MAIDRSNVIRFAKGDERILQLADWVISILGNHLESIDFASEDASFRRYFRVGCRGETFIVMDSPVNAEEFEAFIRIAQKFKQAGMNVPEIFAAEHERGFALLTDFGKDTYLSLLSAKSADSLYQDAIDSLLRLQNSTQTDADFLPPYSDELLCFEMELFREWYLRQHLNIDITREINDILDHSFGLLLAKAKEQPRVWVHLDYHSRNLMVVERDNPGILDFQNAVYGPVTYDLVSLLRDCYIVWDHARIDHWIEIYLTRARQTTELELKFDRLQFAEWFDWMGLQRHIKVAGIFSRLNYRDSKPNYLQDIPRVMAYIQSVSSRYQELKPLHELVAGLSKF